MQLQNTSKYAIRILSYIAKNGNKRLYCAKELSEKLNISYKFLTKIMTHLVKASFIISIKGREGGYRLSKSSCEISIYDILNSLKELENDKMCILGIGECNENNKCALHDQWIQPKELIDKMYRETTLDQLEGQEFKL